MGKREQQLRFLCSELISSQWLDEEGHEEKQIVNLEEIWCGGAALQCEDALPEGALITLDCGKAVYRGHVVSCRRDLGGFTAEIEFEPGYQWSRSDFEPGHFFDPHSLIKKGVLVGRVAGPGALRLLPNWLGAPEDAVSSDTEH